MTFQFCELRCVLESEHFRYVQQCEIASRQAQYHCSVLCATSETNRAVRTTATVSWLENLLYYPF